MADEHSLDRQTSGTAMATAYMRALSASDPRQEIRGSDDLAGIFLTDEQKTAVASWLEAGAGLPVWPCGHLRLQRRTWTESAGHQAAG